MTCEIGATILAAGKGTRLRSAETSKPMTLVAGRPLISYPLEKLYKSAFTTECISIVAGPHNLLEVENYCASDPKVYLQSPVNGNASAVQISLETTTSAPENILIMQGDDCLTAGTEFIGKLLRYHQTSEADITIALTDNFVPGTHRSNYVTTDEMVIERIGNAKDLVGSGFFLAGMFVFRTPFFSCMFQKLSPNQSGELGISQMVKMAHQDNRKVFGVPVNKRWFCINTPLQLFLARDYASTSL